MRQDLVFKNYEVGKTYEPSSKLEFAARTSDMYAIDKGEHIRSTSTVAVLRDTKLGPIIIGEVSPTYNIFQNSGIFHVIERALEKLFDAKTHLRCAITDELAYDGRYCVRQYIIVREVAGRSIGNSTLLFRVVAMNSFDRSKSFIMLAGSIDSFCSNGRVFGEFINMRKAHSGVLDPGDMYDFLQRAYAKYLDSLRVAAALRRFEVSDIKAAQLLHKLENTKVFKDNIVRALDDNIAEHGCNLWAVVSTATWWSSTRDPSWAVPSDDPDRMTMRTLERQQQVMQWETRHIMPLIEEREDYDDEA